MFKILYQMHPLITRLVDNPPGVRSLSQARFHKD